MTGGAARGAIETSGPELPRMHPTTPPEAEPDDRLRINPTPGGSESVKSGTLFG